MKQLRLLAAMIGVFALAIAAGSYLGDGKTRLAPSHDFAFVMKDVCPDLGDYYGCSSIYVAHAEDVRPSLRGEDPRVLPPGTLKVLTRAEWMEGLTWSPDGRQLAYLTPRINVACTPRNLDGSGNHQVDADVFQRPALSRIAELSWRTYDTYPTMAASLGPVAASDGYVDGEYVRGKSVSADGRLTAFNASSGALGSICVNANVETGTRRCFGVGERFGEPVWRP